MQVNSSSVQYSDGTHDLFMTTGELISEGNYNWSDKNFWFSNLSASTAS
jgi:hypothetical protein